MDGYVDILKILLHEATMKANKSRYPWSNSFNKLACEIVVKQDKFLRLIDLFESTPLANVTKKSS